MGESTTKIEQRIPAFWTDHPEQWFQIIEHYFKRNKIENSADKILTVIPLLPDKFRGELSQIDIETNEGYQKLKEIVIKKLKPSDREATDNLFSCIQLGSRRPSELYNEMLCLLGERKMDENILRELWLRKLPAVMHPSLAAAAKLTLKELVDVADNVYEATRPLHCTAPAMMSIHQDDANNQLTLASLFSEIMAIKDELRSRFNSQRRSKSRSFSANRRRSSSRRRTTTDWCWFHRRFGRRARRCQPPCAYGKAQNAFEQGNDLARM
jgi:hypothetical protein